MATVNLGSIKFNWQGAYNGATAYAVDDVVSYNGSSYICKLASTGNLPTNTTYFDQMSSAGTNGTDLTSTLTTQGDLVYRDGSGLQRLGAGTAGQVLQTGGAGANPSWTTMSSDVVLIKTINASNVSSIEMVNGANDVVFDGTYENYKLLINNYWSSSPANPILEITTDSGSTYKSGGYNYQGWRVYYSGNTNGYDQDTAYVKLGIWGSGNNATDAQCFIEATMSKPTNTIYPDIRGLSYGAEANQAMVGMFHGRYQTSTAWNGFRIRQTNSGNFSAQFSLYGIKG